MTARRLARVAAAAAAAVSLGCATFTVPPADAAETPTAPIQNWFGYSNVPNYTGAPAAANPVPAAPPPSHPHMVASSNNNMHGDAWASDTNAGGPLGVNPTVRSARVDPVGGECAAQVPDNLGRLVAVCGTTKGMYLRVFNPATLGLMGALPLGQRVSTQEALWKFQLDKIFTDTSGGAYFYLDDLGRAVLVDPNQKLRVISITDDGSGGVTFHDDAVHDLLPYVERHCWSLWNPNPAGVCDAVTTVLPDWSGRYWWISRYGKVGTVDPVTGDVHLVELAGEEIENSFAVDADGVYIVSDHAMYMFEPGPSGEPVQVWRELYDRGTAQKPSGQLNWGSGTTPTLMGADLVAITDNADPINVVVMDRRAVPAGPRTLCQVPVFSAGQSANDNSLIGIELDDGTGAIVVENNIGYRFFLSLIFGQSVPGGVWRIDVSPDRSSCGVVWQNPARVPSSVSKLSRDTGLVYVYEKARTTNLVDAWYVTAIDFVSGATAWKKLAGTGWNYDNQWASLTPMPGGKLYAGAFNGLVEISDN